MLAQVFAPGQTELTRVRMTILATGYQLDRLGAWVVTLRPTASTGSACRNREDDGDRRLGQLAVDDVEIRAADPACQDPDEHGHLALVRASRSREARHGQRRVVEVPLPACQVAAVAFLGLLHTPSGLRKLIEQHCAEVRHSHNRVHAVLVQ